MLHWSDVRYALRLLRRSPLFTLLTIVVLSGGLGLSIFTFAFLYTAMLKPLPLNGGDRIVRVEQTTPGSGGSFDVVDVAAMRPSITTLTTVGAFARRSLVIGDERHRRVISATATESNMFDLARSRPILGRTLRSDDQVNGAEPVIVLSHWTWQAAFGGDSAIVNRTVALNGEYTRVVGVMPPGFGFPVASEAWIPLGDKALSSTTPGTQSVDLYSRLVDGVSARQAQTEIRQLLQRSRRSRPVAAGEAAVDAQSVGVSVNTFQMSQIGDEGPLALTVLNLLATLILLLACINVMNLLLARANERARETAVRMALGASRGRIIMQSMWESILLCVVGGALATAIATWGLEAINRWTHTQLRGNLAFWWVWGFDRTVILAAGAFVTLVIAVLGGVVAARVANTEFNTVLRDGGARAGSRREGRIARALVVAQVTTVSVLMFFGVMSTVVAYRVANVDVGYDTHNLLSASIAPSGDRYAARVDRGAFFQTIVDGLSRRPAVDGALLRAPIAGNDDREGAFTLGAEARVAASGAPHAYVEGILGPMSVLGIRLTNGRSFDRRDDDHGLPVAIVSSALAQRYWPGRSPVGERIVLAADSGIAQSRTVVGVVSDVLMGNPFSRNRSAVAIYVPLRQTDVSSAEVVFKHRGDAAAAQSDLYETLAAADLRMLPPEVVTFEEILEKTTLIAKSVTKLFAACFGFALLLAVSGTYGLMARSIGQRTREIGIRRALGATEQGVVALLLGQGGRQLGVGVLLAFPVMVAVALGFWNFFPIALTFSISVALMVAASIVSVVLLATYIPTRRVLAVSPRDALWRE